MKRVPWWVWAAVAFALVIPWWLRYFAWAAGGCGLGFWVPRV